MTKNKRRAFAALTASASALLTGTLLIGCTVDSANSVFRSVSANVAGVYRYDSDSCSNDGRFVTANSGQPVSYLDLRQTGDSLEAIDNNGIIFRGTIGDVSDTTASFNLEGSTTAGKGVVVSGSISIGSGKGVMRATWIEETFYATLCGAANGPSVSTNNPVTTNTNGVVITSTTYSEKQFAAYRKLAWWLDKV